MNNKRGWKLSDYAAFSIAALAVVAALTAIYPGWTGVWDFLCSATTVAWVQAVGGIGAIVVALYLSKKSDLAARSAEFDRARIVAANLFVDVVIVDNALEKLHNLDAKTSTKARMQAILRFLEDYDAYKAVFTQQVALSLAPFPEHCGYRLAFGIRAMAVVKDVVDEYGFDFLSELDAGGKNEVYAVRAFKFIEVAHLNFQAARKVIQREVGGIFDDWADLR